MINSVEYLSDPTTNKPITHQPTPNHNDLNSAPASKALSTYPALEVLQQLDELRVIQKTRDAFKRNKFTICTASGEEILCAREGTSSIFIVQVIAILVLVHSPLGVLLGTVEQQRTLHESKFIIKDASGKSLLTITRSKVTAANAGDGIPFILHKLKGQDVGAIVKKWPSYVQATGGEKYCITFPADFDVSIKAIIMGACFLIDYMLYDTTEDEKNVTDLLMDALE
ncbi:Phospholipid scramblase [Sergentomyia squamirostris]